jgi:hypothetical protein
LLIVPDEANGLIDPRLPRPTTALWRAVRLAPVDPAPPRRRHVRRNIAVAVDMPHRKSVIACFRWSPRRWWQVVKSPRCRIARCAQDDPALDLARALLQEAKGDNAGHWQVMIVLECHATGCCTRAPPPAPWN